MTLSPLNRAVYDVVLYADVFNSAVSPEEVHRYVGVKMSLLEVRSSLESLKEKGILGQHKGLYFLRGHSDLSNSRQKDFAISGRHFAKARVVAKMLSFIPWIELVGVTGSLAVGTSSEGDDIDLFLVTSAKRLWFTRFFVVILLRVLGLYRTVVCPNMWLARNSLAFTIQDYYIARELAQMIPLFSRGGCYEEVLAQNKWVAEYVPQWTAFQPLSASFSRRRGGTNSFMEDMFYFFQVMYMKKRITTEIVQKERAFFLSKDVHKSTLNVFEKRRQEESAC